jgi:hypothetical protein
MCHSHNKRDNNGGTIYKNMQYKLQVLLTYFSSFTQLIIFMDRVIGEVFGRAIVEVVARGIEGAVKSYMSEKHSNNSTSSARLQTRTLGSLPIPHERAVLIASSTITFGNDCERLVNIAFRTSQSFPSMMGTCADVSQYLRKELAKQYPGEYFHIIIGENHAFGFSVDDSQYYAEIEQDLYRVLIFATKQDPQSKPDTHDANSQMSFVWK